MLGRDYGHATSFFSSEAGHQVSEIIVCAIQALTQGYLAAVLLQVYLHLCIANACYSFAMYLRFDKRLLKLGA